MQRGAYPWRTQSAEGPVGQRQGREGASPQKQDQHPLLLFTRLSFGGNSGGSVREQGLSGDGTRGRMALVEE